MRFGLIGCGGIGVLRAHALKAFSESQLKAVCDVNETVARRLAERFGGEVVHEWKEVLKDATIDAVIISTPPDLHAEMCLKALAAGKHVLCEKPLARTTEECQKMVEAAAKAERVLATGFNYRFYPSILKAREIFDSGLIGELDHIRSYTGYSASEHSQEWLHDVKVMGGGSLRDNGIHLIDLTCYFLGDIAEVKGFSSNSVWNFESCEDNGFALLKNQSGKIASLQASWTEWRGYQLKIEIYGSLGCISASCFPMLTQVLWFDKNSNKTNKKTHFFPKTFIGEHLKTYRWVVTQSFIKEFRAFEQAVKGGRSAIASGMDGLRAVDIAQTVSGLMRTTNVS